MTTQCYTCSQRGFLGKKRIAVMAGKILVSEDYTRAHFLIWRVVWWLCRSGFVLGKEYHGVLKNDGPL
jgi:hypothetical protein